MFPGHLLPHSRRRCKDVPGTNKTFSICTTRIILERVRKNTGIADTSPMKGRWNSQMVQQLHHSVQTQWNSAGVPGSSKTPLGTNMANTDQYIGGLHKSKNYPN